MVLQQAWVWQELVAGAVLVQCQPDERLKCTIALPRNGIGTANELGLRVRSRKSIIIPIVNESTHFRFNRKPVQTTVLLLSHLELTPTHAPKGENNLFKGMFLLTLFA